MKKPYTSSILGVNISITNMQEMINLILEQLEELKGQYVCFSNVHTTVMAYENPAYRQVQNASFVALPDGSPLSYVQRLWGHKEARRVAGPDFMAEMWKATENTEISHYFYGSSESTIASLKECLNTKYPNLKIAGMESPPFRPLTEEEDEEAIRRINESGASILWVGLGAPKQEEWMYNHRDKINAVMMGVGAGFDFHAGIAKRAPMWMQTHYLEWLYRLIQDPKRLWKRYVKTNGKFVALLAKTTFEKDNQKLPRGDEDKKNLLIYAHYYYPDVASTGQILTDLAEGLRDSFNITVICTVPSYTGRISQHYRKHKYYYENINGVQVLRIRVPEFRKSFKLSRIYNIAQYFVSAIFATFKTGKQDYVYSISQPPILGGLLGVIGKWIKKAKFIYNIQDFNPEQIMAVKYANNKLVLNAMMTFDKFSCRKSDQVIVVGRDMVETLKARFADIEKSNKEPKEDVVKLSQDVVNRKKQALAENANGKSQIGTKNLVQSEKTNSKAQISTKYSGKIRDGRHTISYTCINNWIDEKEIVPLPDNHEKLTKFRHKLGLDGKYVIMYSGNIGLYYDLLNLIKVIEKFKNEKDVVFLFAGAGSVLDELKKYVKEHQMNNVQFIPYQKKSHLVYSLNLGDVHLVVNAKGIKGVSVPSKLYGVMAAGKPVFGILEKGSEARVIVEECGCGKCVDPGDYKAIEELTKEFIQGRNSVKQSFMGKAGREYLEKNLTKDISIAKYRDTILQIPFFKVR